MRIRRYEPRDLERVYEICRRTGAAGGDATSLVDDEHLFGEIWAAPYVTLEPEHCFVVTSDDGIAQGYILGTRDAVDFEDRCEELWWPPLRQRYPKDPDGGTLKDLLIALIHDRPEPRSDLHDRYPSELHIDLLPVAQGKGHGAALMDRLFTSLREAGSVGVHLGVSVENTRAVAFYRHLGFGEFDCDGITRTFVMDL